MLCFFAYDDKLISKNSLTLEMINKTGELFFKKTVSVKFFFFDDKKDFNHLKLEEIFLC